MTKNEKLILVVFFPVIMYFFLFTPNYYKLDCDGKYCSTYKTRGSLGSEILEKSFSQEDIETFEIVTTIRSNTRRGFVRRPVHILFFILKNGQIIKTHIEYYDKEKLLEVAKSVLKQKPVFSITSQK